MLFPASAWAIPAITCHCFTDRSYDPAHPTVADPYFLATTQNAFFAGVFDLDRKTVVMKKQGGTSGDDLWVAYGVASRAGVSAEGLLEGKKTKDSWHDLLAPLAGKNLGAHFTATLAAKGSSARLAEAVVDDLLLRYQLMNEGELTALRKLGATNQELLLAILLGSKTHQPVRKVYAEAKGGRKSWGALLQAAGTEAGDIPGEMVTLVKSHRR
jgi:hypothetical protein